MEEYEYLENLNSEELAKIIDQMLDFEETTKALMILEEKDSQKALELGKDIIKNNKGDDYLQATVWNVFFFDNQKDMIDVIDKRKEEIGKILLDEIIIDLTKNKVAISKDFLEKLRRTYAAIDNKMNIDAVMDCPEYASEEYKDFIRAYTEHNFWGENKQVIENIETACLLIQQDHNYFKEFVLENKAINIVTKKGSLLNYAIQLKDNEIAEWLIEEKIDINSFDGLELLTALKMNNTRIALQLLRHGIITDGDEMKSNPLLFAIKIGSRELVEELMTKHRHLVAVYTNEYVKNYTILDIAKRYKNDQIIQTVKKYL